MKRRVSILLVVCLLATMCFGMAIGTANAEGEKLKIRIAIMQGPKLPDTWLEKEIETKLGVDFEPIFLPGWDDAQAKIRMIMSDPSEMPDVIWWWGMPKDYQQWVDAGLLQDLTPHLKSDGRNVLGYYNINNMFGSYTKGGIYRIPGDVAEPSCMTTMIRGDWLKALNMETPKTVEEYAEMVRRFTKEDPDQNGQDDTYGFTGEKLEWRSWAPFFYPYKADPHYFIKQDDGTVVYGATQPAIKEALKVIIPLYAEGCIDPSLLTTNDLRAIITGGKAGSLYRWIGYFNPADDTMTSFKTLVPTGEWIATDPMVGPNGFSSDEPEEDWGWCYYGITSACQNPAETFKALDALASSEMYVLRQFGVEGDHFKFLEDGTLEFIKNEDERNADGIGTFTSYLNRKDAANIANVPSVTELFAHHTETSQPMRDIRIRFMNPDRPMWNQYGTELEKLRDEYLYGIISGEKPIEAFDEFVTLFYENGGREVEAEANEMYKAQAETFSEFEKFWTENFADVATAK